MIIIINVIKRLQNKQRKRYNEMKKYGSYKATDFTKKQINVIFAKAKKGELKVEKWFMSDMYEMADYYGHDFNGSAEQFNDEIMNLLDYVFSGDNEKAQKKIYTLEDIHFSLKSNKNKAKCDRTVFVA